MSPAPRLIEALGELGFSQYEARAFCALLAAGPMNGHEVARASGIPPAKIYETLGRLAEKGAVLVARSDPVRYTARPWEDVLAGARSKFEGAVDAVASGLRDLPTQDDGGAIWTLPDRPAVLDFSLRLIGAARRTVFASVWDPEMPALGPALEAAARRGCTVHVAIYGTSALEGAFVYDLTNCGRSAMERMAGRRLMTLVTDGNEAIIAEIRPDDSVQSVRTDNPVIGLLVSEYVKADVLGRLLIDDMGEARFESLRHHPGTIDALLRT
ncbi:TrmB family transcriptional regulator [Sinirhodobacter populi]|uniref:TrmB family transcriptional regulator n=1 Tax=Paenirhodobacter populi TaxID=2306993 RepID=A0A443KGK4_9RHOB|nr:helix-turn-helix domain-containing protein [Sinirhodobacter populi]RWR31883.1 TrmB family transcriptional regulator [Sinirhodobacter populi]